jgi:hypothetical protein
MKICSFEGCGRKHQAKGLCVAHWNQQRRVGKLSPLRGYNLELMDRIALNTAQEGSCIVWLGAKDKKGYGHLGNRKGSTMVHRIVYENVFGAIPNKMTVHHKCAKTSCCNPDHLELATQRENIGEMFARKAYEVRISELEAEVAALKAKYERE